jgi:hypothetical protein
LLSDQTTHDTAIAMRICLGLLITISEGDPLGSFIHSLNEFAKEMPRAKGLRQIIHKITAREIGAL